MSSRRGNHLREGDLLARRYLLVERIGAGGMSVIWRGIDQSLQREVAIKVRDAPLSAARSERELIRHEARAAAHIEHPDAIEVYDYGEAVTSRGRLAAYVVMQLLDGEPLAERIAAGPLPWCEAVSIAARVASVLAAAHRRGIVHRDVTPDNVLLTTNGVKLLDFGIAARVGEPDTAGGATFGTPPYVAPERLTDGPVVPATDVYSLGVLLFEALTGVTPYRETTWAEIEAAQRDGPPPVPDADGLPDSVGRLCQRCLAGDPAERPAAQAVADELFNSLVVRRVASRRPAGLVAAGVALTAVAVFVGYALSRSPSTPPDSARGPAPTGPSVVASTGTAPPTTTAPTPARPSSRPSPAPPGGGGTRVVPGVTEAANAVNAVIDRGASRQEIRPDVVIDLRQQLHNLLSSRNDHWPLVESLRVKLQDRLRERSITPEIASELDAAVLTLGRALDAA